MKNLQTAPNKFYVALTGVIAAVALIVKNGAGDVSNEEWYSLIIACSVAFGVFFTSNPPVGPDL